MSKAAEIAQEENQHRALKGREREEYMPVVSMEFSELEKKERASHQTLVGGEQPKFPPGLQLRLGPDELKKLGITTMPSIDSKMAIIGKVEVVDVESRKTQGDVPEHHLTLQIVELGVDPDTNDKEIKSAGETLYG